MSTSPSLSVADRPQPRSRTLYIGTNTKLQQTNDETVAYLDELGRRGRTLLDGTDTRLFLCPPYTSLPAAVPAARATNLPVWIGAQNVEGHLNGAFTGEISTPMLAALGTDLVLIGHAERRTLFGETNESVARKVGVALEGGLRVMLCVGENADDRAHGVGVETVRRQVKIALSRIDRTALDRVLIAYEPAWAIGASTAAGPDDIRPILAEITAALNDRFGTILIERPDVPLLYGGSVSVESVAPLLRELPNLDGFLLGRVGLTVEGLLGVTSAAIEERRGAVGG
ncbi:MAG TPA: triose-phosphate isomerase family protein [Thermomicrobiales bacterium]|jgi:triosephosphate isomerase|nr:triose-phosphate isomerase family protein [Thermomicrobiales bacterium]